MVLPYHPLWNLGTVAASHFGTLQFLSAGVSTPPVRRNPGERMDLLLLTVFAQGCGVPYLTLS